MKSLLDESYEDFLQRERECYDLLSKNPVIDVQPYEPITKTIFMELLSSNKEFRNRYFPNWAGVQPTWAPHHPIKD